MNTIHSATRPSRDAPFATPREVANLRANDDPGGFGRPEISADGLSLYMQHVHLNPRDSDVYISQRASVNDPWGLALGNRTVSSQKRGHEMRFALDSLIVANTVTRQASMYARRVERK
jgi:hypothetical protein